MQISQIPFSENDPFEVQGEVTERVREDRERKKKNFENWNQTIHCPIQQVSLYSQIAKTFLQ